MSNDALSLLCEWCDVPLKKHLPIDHEWQLRRVDRPLLSKSTISEMVRTADARRSSVKLPPPTERQRIRVAAGWTQQMIAQQVAMSRDAVGRWETSGPNGREPRPDVAWLYDQILNDLIDIANGAFSAES